METARTAASEKFNTAVIEMTAEVKQRLSAFSTICTGAAVGDGGGTRGSAKAGTAENARKSATELTCGVPSQLSDEWR